MVILESVSGNCMHIILLIGLIGLASWLYVMLKSAGRILAREIKKELGKG